MVQFAAGGTSNAFKALTGRCLQNPKTSVNDQCVLRAEYGPYRSLFQKALRGLPSRRKTWKSRATAMPIPGRTGPKGPIFELYPLKAAAVSISHDELLRICPWGPAKIRLGKHRSCHLVIAEETGAVSNSHAELCLIFPLDTPDEMNLVVSDMSTNGTWVNERRLTKDRFEELKDGDVLCLADVASYVPRIASDVLAPLESFFGS